MTAIIITERTLEQLADDGLCVDDWSRWQQGQCGTYAVALIEAQPNLRFGAIDFTDDPGYDNPGHYVAHDDLYAYDSAGRHPLPYNGVHGYGRWLPDIGDPLDHGLPYEEHGSSELEEPAALADATTHAARNGILVGRHADRRSGR